MAVVSFLICDNVLKQKYFVITDVEASKKRMGINIAFQNPAQAIQHYGIKFVSDLRQVGGFLRVLQFPPTNKTDCQDITEILLIVA
jgi:hypothetical protein